MPKSKRDVVLAALYAYANPYDPDSPSDHQEAIDLAIEFLETFAGLSLDSCLAPSGKSYSYDWLLRHMRHAFGDCPAHVHIQFLMDLGLIRTDLIEFDDVNEEDEVEPVSSRGTKQFEAQPNLPGVADH